MSFKITIEEETTVVEPVREWKQVRVPEGDELGREHFAYVTTDQPVTKKKVVYEQIVEALQVVDVINAVNKRHLTPMEQIMALQEVEQ